MTITISESIKQEIAEKLVEQAHPGYDKGAQGEWFVANGSRVMHRERTAAWNPWHDDAVVISVEELAYAHGGASIDNADFDPSPADDVSEQDAYAAAVLFALSYVPDSYEEA